ncbi:ABC-2 type transport system permease protein [Pedobacter steynii]|uniref:Transport permease protein n=1 Tax=Pedobacter steynii TaxID=430522 RepID=A0A1H0HSQ2_9SPHI|nr:ABC transporter permease [Pedobacter steynii]NQX42527.1 ABC transporter permease [Pedobacter steynii]SDO21811.1 ABC-2 type transport system permease protein [Pedobacter steynii]
MSKPYNNTKATLALAKASFRSIMRSPSAVVFTLAFPLVFILVFGFLGGGGVKVDLAIAPGSDLQNPIIKSLEDISMVHIIKDKDAVYIKTELEKGHIDAVIDVQKNPAVKPAYLADIKYTSASLDKGNILKSVIHNLMYTLNTKDVMPTVAQLNESTVQGRIYRTIDFILPGQLGFSLLSTGVFGTAFVFFSLRQTLVIKRFFATPVRKSSIVFGEGIARIGFALLGAVFIILLGHFCFHFTLINGAVTVLNMLLLAIIGLIVFMGFGFVVSGIAKSESTIPPIANIITLPQFLLSGTFFSIDAFPTWLQPISRALPLTYLNDAMRKVAFEGAGLWDVKHQILIMVIWGIGIYAVAVKVFKWE